MTDCAIPSSQYRGATSFFTVNLADRTKRLLVEHVEVFREVI
ncbi:MAG TPA: hypothetical protein VM532_16725 [Burkholderiales bacterium]|nr:hypothetical protein [Burkholderiales bacterium]